MSTDGGHGPRSGSRTARMGRAMTGTGAIRLGGLGPLAAPGIAWAGRELLAGMELAVEEVNSGGGIGGRPLELLFEDTRGLPAAGLEALERLFSAGVCALVGEFHSVVADVLAERADQAGVPFIASSPTLDSITARRSPYVFRLAPLARREMLDGRLVLGDPAGRAIFPDWWDTVGEHGAGVPYLSYAPPNRLTPAGRHIATVFREQHGRDPSFVALEGYDTIRVLARALEDASRLDAQSICAALRTVEAPGTRGLVLFSLELSLEPGGTVHQQWAWPPVCVAARSQPGEPLSEAEVLWQPV